MSAMQYMSNNRESKQHIGLLECRRYKPVKTNSLIHTKNTINGTLCITFYKRVMRL